MPKPGPRKTYRYSNEFKATAVRLSELPGVAISDVAFREAILKEVKALAFTARDVPHFTYPSYPLHFVRD